MGSVQKRRQTIYRLALILAGGVFLINLAIHPDSGSSMVPGILIALFIAAQYLFPINLSYPSANLMYLLTLSGSLLYGESTACWATLLGVTVGLGIQLLRGGKESRKASVLEAAFTTAVLVLPAIVAVAIRRWASEQTGADPASWSWIALTILLFSGCYLGLLVADQRLANRRTILKSTAAPSMPAIILIALPFIFLTALTGGLGSLFGIGGGALIFTIFLHKNSATRADLARRVQDLYTLNQISGILRSTLDLENLLDIIQKQITELLNIDNFYVALHDPRDQSLWYPLALKHGTRQAWPSRPLSPDRLTDRVIRHGKPLLFNPASHTDAARAGLPASEETPSAWVGVPLVTPERTIGCLAVFSFSPEIEFTPQDTDLLVILSGQVSIAIENALLYEQTNHRAAQLETLNRITGLITASLDPNEVITQVCRSVTEVGGAQHSAIFLLSPERGEVTLADSYGLSPNFTRQNSRFSIAHNSRMRCLRTGRPVLLSTLEMTLPDLDYFGTLQQEGIQSYGEFPLTTPDGRIGFLAVYFDAPHVFHANEVELLQTFASQAALAVANAHLYTQTDQALSRRAYQLSILEAVGRELSAAINSERLFEMILNYALEFTNSRWGELSLYLPASRTLEVKTRRGFPRDQEPVGDDALAKRAVSTQAAVLVGDVRSEPEFADQTGGQASSQMCVPMLHEGRVLGVISLLSDRPHAYTPADQSFISQLANQASVAVVNAELYSETRRRLREQSILHLINMHLVGNPEIEMVLQTLSRSMEAVLEGSRVGVYLWDERSTLYRRHSATHSETRRECSLPEEIPLERLEPYHTALMKTGPLKVPSERGRELQGDCQHCQALVFPLLVKKLRMGMALIHIDTGQRYSEDDLQLLRTIAGQVSISLQNARLFADVTRGHDRLAAVLNSVEEGILMIEPGGRIQVANEAIERLTGLHRQDLVDCHLANMRENDLRALGYTRLEVEALLADLERGKLTTPPRTTFRSGEVKPERILERTITGVAGAGGKTAGWMILLRDMTEQRQVEEAREIITNTLIHDLRSPVSAVLGAVDIIDLAIKSSASDHEPLGEAREVNSTRPDQIQSDIAQAVRIARLGTSRVMGLIETILDISKMQTGEIELSLEPLDLGNLIAAAVEEFIHQANDYGILLRQEISTGMPQVIADRSKLVRVISNLVDNALKFTPSGGQITLSACAKPGNQVEVRVADTGPGIPPEYREKIFERFTQVPNQRGRRRGSGLGLPFCRMAIEAHGGRILVETQPLPETGSIFILTLPVDGPEPRYRPGLEK